MVFLKYQLRGVRVPFPALTCIGGPSDEVWYFCRFAAGTLGPTTFKLGLGEACLCIFFMNMIFAIYPAYL